MLRTARFFPLYRCWALGGSPALSRCWPVISRRLGKHPARCGPGSPRYGADGSPSAICQLGLVTAVVGELLAHRAVAVPFADDHVVHDRDVEHLPAVNQTPRQSLVFIARRRIARGMVVGEDDGLCAAADGGAEDFAGVDDGLVQQAQGDQFDPQDMVLGVEAQNPEVLFVPVQFALRVQDRSEDRRYVRRAVDPRDARLELEVFVELHGAVLSHTGVRKEAGGRSFRRPNESAGAATKKKKTAIPHTL